MSNNAEPNYADLHACCVCLGFRDENEYKIDGDAAASIRSILLYLRREGVNCDIRRELGNIKILTSDLIPLLKACGNDTILFDLAVRLAVGLTQPAIVCFRNEIPKDPNMHAAFLQLDSVLKDYKRAFADEQLFQVLAERVEYLFDKQWEERSDDDRMLVERILILIRNVLHILPDSTNEHQIDEEISVHDQLLWAMHLSGWDELLLFLANSDDERSAFAFHTLEIISLMLREQAPEQLAGAGNPSIDRDSQSLIVERCHFREQAQKRAALIELNMRQNRFGGTFELGNTKSLSNRPLIYHHDVTAAIRKERPASANEENVEESFGPKIGRVDLNLGKKIKRKPRNRKPLIEREFHRRSILSIQIFLRNFCWQFLRNCYNPLMNVARGAILRQNTQANDETYYLWAMNFFMAFSRSYNFRPDYLSESLSISVFNWIYTLSMGYREALCADKRGGATNPNALQGSRRLALAVSAYRQFLLCLQEMIKPSANRFSSSSTNGEVDETVEERENRLRLQNQVVESLMSNIFYVAEYQDLYPQLLKEYNESIQSKEYLIDLVEGAHLFINLLVHQEKSSRTLVVSRRRRRRHLNEKNRQLLAERRQRQRDAAALRRKLRLRTNETPDDRDSRLRRAWVPLSANLLSALAKTDFVVESGVPQLFDPAMALDSESMAAQLRNAIRLVHVNLHENKADLAVAIARSIWDIWPEAAPSVEQNQEDLDEDLLMEKERALEAGLPLPRAAEFISLRKIFLLDLNDEELEALDASIREEEVNEENEEANELISRELDESDDEYDVISKEFTFDLNSFILRFTHPYVIRSLTLLLENYALNPASINLCLVQFLHRIAVKQHLPGILFQLRLFRVFQNIAQDPCVAQLGEFKELLKLVKYILRKFFEAFERNRNVAVEALFFRSTKESAEAYSGYGTYEHSNKATQWTPELDKELSQLFEAYRYDPVPLGEDLIDVLRRNLSDPNKSRRQIIMRLVSLGKASSAKELKMMTIRAGEGRKVTRSRRPWMEDELNLLQSLFLENKGAVYLLSDVMDALKLDYEDKLKNRTTEDEVEPILRSRREVSKKLIELGLASDPSDFGKSRRLSRRKTESQLEVVDGEISMLRKKSHRRQKRSRKSTGGLSSPELHFDGQLTDNEISSIDVDSAIQRPNRSVYFDPDDSEESNSDENAVAFTNTVQPKDLEYSHSSSSSDGKSIEEHEILVVSQRKRRKIALEDENDEEEEPLNDDSGDDFLQREIELAIGETDEFGVSNGETKQKHILTDSTVTSPQIRRRRTRLLDEDDN